MDTNDAVTDLYIRHGRVLPDNLSAKDRGVEGDGAGGVRGPDDVFESFDVHGRQLTDVRRSENEEMAFPLAISEDFPTKAW
jgi:hypothetical protein